MKIVATIEARMNSSRLPGKVLKPICGKPMLELMVERLQCCKKLDQIVIATADNSSCDAIETLAEKLGVDCFRGSEDDVLDRVLKAAGSVEADAIVELTGDCPLMDPEIVDQLVTAYVSGGKDYCSNVLARTYPAGMDVQVFGYSILERVAALTQDPDDREHVSLYIYQHPEMFSLQSVKSNLPDHMAEWRLVVDTPEDFELTTRIFEALYSGNSKFGLSEISQLLEKNPEWLYLNK